MSFDWKEEWENHSEQETKYMKAKSEDTLLNDIAAGFYGSYYAIWYAVADKKNPNKSIPILTDALQKLETDKAVFYDQLTAIHCAEALCILAKITDDTQRSELVYGNRLETVEFFRNFITDNLV
jgi:hypothetical protein